MADASDDRPDPLELLVRAGHPLIAIENADEQRVLEVVRRLASALSRPLFEWSITTGLAQTHPEQGELLTPEGKPSAALQRVCVAPGPALYVFKDMGIHAKEAYVQRQIRDAIQLVGSVRSTLLFVDAVPLPDHVRRFAYLHELKPPTTEELAQAVRNALRKIDQESLQSVDVKISKRQMEQLIQSLRGLSCSAAARIVASVVYDDFTLNAADLARVVEAKRQLLASVGCLEAIEADFHTDDIGGLANLKNWLKQRRRGFSQQAREFGISPPRGMLMLGVQGCGKSLCAKVVAADWNMPLMRLDPGTLYQKYIGDSEGQLRQALRQAEAMAPVVLWIDEIEKAFASVSGDSSDGGLSQRMFGTLLSWMQDHREPIFLIATANTVNALPPELMRKGRFDEVFFVDLPVTSARQEIFRIHLERRKRDPAKFDLVRLAIAAEGFSGAEIEQVVISALYRAFEEKTELADRHILYEINITRPLAVLHAESIEALRDWARDRCVPAD